MSNIDSPRPNKRPSDVQRSLTKRPESLTHMVDLINGFRNSSTAELMLRHQREANKVLQGALGPNSQSMKALQHLTRLASHDINVSSAALAAHPSWNRELKRMSKYLSSTQGRWTPTLKDMSHAAVLGASREFSITAGLTRQITVGAIADNLKIEQSVASTIRNSLTGLDNTYAKLAQSFEGIEDLIRRPAFVLPGATREVVTTGRVMESLLPTLEPPPAIDWDIEDKLDTEDVGESSELVNLLESISPKFAELYSGALKALESDNPERSRHVLTSLRELANHLLRELAPLELLEKWIDSHGGADLLHKGKPTRRAKIRYILRDVDDKPLTKFVATDAGVMVKLFELYDRLHELEMNITDKQLRAIVFRTESYWRYVLRVREL